MYNRIFLTLTFFISCLVLKTQGQALHDYEFSMDTTEYRSLDLDHLAIVSIDSFGPNTMVPINIGFPFSFGEETFTQLTMTPQGSVVMADPISFPDRAWTISGFSTNLIDKSFDGSGIDSKLRYVYDGLPGNQVLKMEWHRVGFSSGKMVDEMQMQMWLHEGTNKISLHFGPIVITDSMDVFSLSSGPPVTALLDIDWSSETASGIYVSGRGNDPTVTQQAGNLMYAYQTHEPISGTVYKFCPNGPCNEVSTVLAGLRPDLSFQIGPNPAQAFTRISVDLNTTGDLSISLLNMTGKRVETMSNYIANPGNHKFNFNTRHHPSGMYMVRLIWNDHVYTRKLVVRNQ